MVEFPIPDEKERLDIWKRAVPAEAPIAHDVDLEFLARKFRLAGGHIRNITLAAAFLAASTGEQISMKHLVRATRREYQKLLKMTTPADFDPYHDLFKDVLSISVFGKEQSGGGQLASIDSDEPAGYYVTHVPKFTAEACAEIRTDPIFAGCLH